MSQSKASAWIDLVDQPILLISKLSDAIVRNVYVEIYFYR